MLNVKFNYAKCVTICKFWISKLTVEMVNIALHICMSYQAHLTDRIRLIIAVCILHKNCGMSLLCERFSPLDVNRTTGNHQWFSGIITSSHAKRRGMNEIFSFEVDSPFVNVRIAANRSIATIWIGVLHPPPGGSRHILIPTSLSALIFTWFHIKHTDWMVRWWTGRSPTVCLDGYFISYRGGIFREIAEI